MSPTRCQFSLNATTMMPTVRVQHLVEAFAGAFRGRARVDVQGRRQTAISQNTPEPESTKWGPTPGQPGSSRDTAGVAPARG
jgi:hypothetical protein